MEIPNKPGVYLLKNRITNKIYIGKAKNLRIRIKNHAYSINDFSKNSYISKSIKKYGWDKFDIVILDVYDEVDNNFLLERESFWIKDLNATNPNIGYNLCEYSNDWTGKKHKKQTKEKLKNVRLGKRHSNETKFLISKNNGKGFLNRKHSPETKEKMKQIWRDRKRHGWVSNHLGKKRTMETRNKISQAKIELYKTKSNPFLGKKHTTETKKLISRANKRRDFSYRLRRVKQINPINNEIIKIWDSIKDASLFFVNKKYSHIGRACKENKTAFGFKWEYEI
jgi:hypothetical protein